MRLTRTVVTLVASMVTVTMLTATIPGRAFADNDTTTTHEVAAALGQVDAHTGLVAEAMESPAVNIPNDPDMGVRLQTPSQSIAIGLPNAARSGVGVVTAQGITAYAGRNGSANAAIPTNGGVQLLTVIENHQAPTRYDYPVTLPAGGTIKVIPGGMGAAIFDAEGQPITLVRSPWAKDANGRDVRTHFTTNGSALTQHVAHKMRSIAYPVVADPVILPAWAVWRLLICLGGGLWGYLSGGGNSFDERLFQAAVGCLGFTTARQLFRR